MCRRVNRRSGGKYCLHLQGRKIRERGTSVNRWLQTEPPVSLPSCSYIAGCFRLVAQSVATCSSWFLASGFFYKVYMLQIIVFWDMVHFYFVM
jgi:hypothetical protein